MQPENNYLYFVVLDENQQVRANIIGTQHTVDRRDKNLNSRIIDAIKRSSKAVLEILPNSKLIPSVPSPEWVIEREIKPLRQQEADGLIEDANISDEIEKILSTVEKETDPQDYEKILFALKEIPSDQNKFVFLEAILKNISEFNEVSLEENLNKIVIENGIEIAPLEDIDLAELLIEAQKERVHEKVPLVLDENQEFRKKSIQKDIYNAWMRGDLLELGSLLDECHELNKEPPEIARIHASRDENMAKRIIDVVVQAKNDDKETLIVLGSAHLLYSKRKNVIEFLNEQFRSDLKGWSITQIKF